MNDMAAILFPLRVLGLLLALVPVLAGASGRVQVIETDPPATATLDRWEQFYLRIAYETDRPIRVRAEAYAGTTLVPSATSGSPYRDAGKGEAVFWFSYLEPARVDRIVVWTEDGRTQQPIAQTEIAVDLTWTGRKAAAPRPRPEWVVQFRADQAQYEKRAMQERASRPVPWWEIALFLAAVWSIPLYFIVQVVALRRWRGGWRIAAAVPAVPMALLLGHAILAMFAGSNLSPIYLIFTCPPALIYLAILFAIRWYVMARPRA